MTKFCPSCGEELVDGARFCKSCGVSVEDYNAEPKRPEMPKVEEKSYAAYFIIGYVVALLSPILGILQHFILQASRLPEGQDTLPLHHTGVNSRLSNQALAFR